jgi:hypothetical protein
MTKKLLLAALAIVVAVGFAGCGKKADQLTLTVGDSQTESENAIQKFNGTMRELMAKGQPVKCDYELTDSGMTVKSTLYVSGKMMRVEGSAPVNAKQVLTSHMILNGGDDYAYIWMDDGTGKGTKMKMEDPAAKTDGSQVKGESGSADLDAKIEFSCSKWSAEYHLHRFFRHAEKSRRQHVRHVRHASGQRQGRMPGEFLQEIGISTKRGASPAF